METELWPNHIHQCAKRGIPVALANARLSERSAKGYGRFSKLTAPMLAEMSLFAVQTEAEAQRFRESGRACGNRRSHRLDQVRPDHRPATAAARRRVARAMAGAGAPGVDRRQYPRRRRRSGAGGPSSVARQPSRCVADSGAAPSGALQPGVRTVPAAGFRHGASLHGRSR